jgi:predicted ATP-dependent endonuclease of OLD family
VKLASLHIKNFRCIKEAEIELSEYTCFVGPNGAGKSTALAALNVLFRAYQGGPNGTIGLSEEDFHHGNVAEPVVVTATFTELNDSAQEAFAAYVRHGQLVINAKAEWNADLQQADVRQFGARMVIPAFAPFFKAAAEGAKVAELKDIYNACREQYPALQSVGTKAAMEEALRTFEESHPEYCELLDSEDQFYGWSKGANKLSSFIQRVYIPAVKDATSEQDEGRNTALGQLLQRAMGSRTKFEERLTRLRREVQEQYVQILRDEERGLQDLSDVLERRLKDWAHPGAQVKLKWHHDPTKSITIHQPYARAKVGEDRFIGDLFRLGHGLQRSFLVSLLQELASTDDATGPRLLLGFEEPELYQHPPQARHLAGVLESLAEQEAQVLVTTHSPLFVSARGFESVRMTRKNHEACTTVTGLRYEDIAHSLADALGGPPPRPTAVMAKAEQIMQPSQNELFFTKLAVLVEGQEDVAFLTAHMQISSRWDEFRKLGFHFVVAGGKTNLSRPLAIANGLGIPAFVIFDADMNKPKEAAKHRRDNACLLSLCGHRDAEAEPTDNYWAENVVMWRDNIASAVYDDVSQEAWDEAESAARVKHGFTEGFDSKNNLLIAATLELLSEQGVKSTVLDRVCDAIIDFGRQSVGRIANESESLESDGALAQA